VDVKENLDLTVLSIGGRPLRDLRAEQFLSLRELATLAGVAPSTVYSIEAGRSTPQLGVALTIAKALGVRSRDVAEFRQTTRRRRRRTITRSTPL
jgi:DNA-binding XRE family transcriptional regulator